MDIKEKALEIVSKLKNDPKLLEKFNRNPAEVVEELLGVQLPEAEINKAVDFVKAKLDLDKAGALLGGLFGKK